MKHQLTRKFVLIPALLSLFSATPALADECSGGPWNHVVLFDVPPQSAFICKDIVASMEWLSSGCNAKYPGSVAVTLGTCEEALPPYEYYAYGNCQCPSSKAPVANIQSKYPLCEHAESEAGSPKQLLCLSVHQ